jgi:ABC-2 type transport system ATP-binding protein
VLEVREVSKMYENQRGVRHMDFSMSHGEIVGFLGPNGAGKTTTMRMITGYLNPTKGQILVDGLSMADHPKKARRKIGYLPETPPLYPEMSVGAYLKFVADLRDIPVREQRARIGEAVEKLGLKGREKQIIKGLSKGYRQRLGLAQAILHQPDLLILDEPTSGLDPKQIIEIRQLIKELGEKHTVLLSTHILPEVNTLCNRVLIINQGQIVMDGNPEELGGQMENKFQVSLEIRGEREHILRELAMLPQVEAVKLREQQAPESGSGSETSSLLVSARDRTDIREAIFFRMAELGLPILEMKRENLSLEDIFLQLTSQDPSVVVREDEAAPQTAEPAGNNADPAAETGEVESGTEEGGQNRA